MSRRSQDSGKSVRKDKDAPAPACPACMVNGFQSMADSFKSNVESLISEVKSNFTTNLHLSVKNYTDLINSYEQGYMAITNGAQQANKQMIDGLDKHYSEFKTNFNQLFNDTIANTNKSLGDGIRIFQAQCDQIVEKYPTIPDKSYKDALKTVTESKGKLQSEMEKHYREVVDKIEKNFQSSRKELILHEARVPKIPPLHVNLPPPLPTEVTGSLPSTSKKTK